MYKNKYKIKKNKTIYSSLIPALPSTEKWPLKKPGLVFLKKPKMLTEILTDG